jgi:NADH:ubiquinone oxidoreductase subunit F (NADH-binding)/Pyruvate/2-oxoacid:ferredoxin oxidoreductase delta subunit
LVCHANEEDPCAYVDRNLLEGNPHAIIEGMLIGAFGTGAREGFVYVRNGCLLAIEHVGLALGQAYELGLLGPSVLGTDFAFELSLVRGAGALVGGDETALLRSIEGIEGKPTAIDNVETWANVVLIMERGAEVFAEIGTRGNSGTKIFSLAGKVKNTGLVEIPMGMTLGEITESIGGGASGKAPIKAVQTGGPSGGCIPKERFDLPVDYDSLTDAGSSLGSGGMIVVDEQTCMVDVAKYFMRFLKDESCGKCLPCRKGTQRMYEILDDICAGDATVQDLTLLWELAHVVKDTTQCGLGQRAANPVLSTLRYFSEEYLAHLEHGRCPAGVCRALITFAINENCQGCDACAPACPQGAITGTSQQRHRIDPDKCRKCGSCRSVCQTDAVYVT